MALTSDSPPTGGQVPGPAPIGVPPAPAVRTRRAMLGSRRRQVAAAAVIAAAVAFLLVQGLGNATQYFKTADQAVAERAHLGTRQFRLEGTVDNDVRRVGNSTSFSVTANNVTVAVVDSNEPPQLFKPDIPVVLEGHWAGNVFASDLIMVKHSASYAEAHPDRLKPQAPAPPGGGQ